MSCAHQLEACRQFATQHDWHVAAEFHDDGISGTRGREARSEWDRMLGKIEAGELAGGVVLTWDLDRWSRDWADGMIEALRLSRFGVDLADTRDGLIDQQSLTGRIMLALKLAGSDEFIAKLRRGVLRGLASKRQNGYWSCPPPFGYTLRREDAGSVLQPDLHEAEVVREIYRLLDSGTPLVEISRLLNGRGERTKRGGRWSQATIRGIARNPVYIGKVVHWGCAQNRRGAARLYRPPPGMVTYEGRHEPILDRGLWERVVKMLEPGSKREHRPPRHWPLTGLVVCGECGGICSVTGGPLASRAYRCRPYGQECCENRRTVRVLPLQAAVVAWARCLVARPGELRVIARDFVAEERRLTQSAAARRREVEREIHESESKRDKLLAALYEGVAPSLLRPELDVLVAELDQAHQRLRDLGAGQEIFTEEDFLAWIMEALRNATIEQCRRVVDRIVVPAAQQAPLILEAFGKKWELLVTYARDSAETEPAVASS